MSVKYHNIPTSERDNSINVEEGCVVDNPVKPGFVLRVVSHVLTLASYAVFVVLFPLTYWFCVRRVLETERIIIFRLGALIGSRGPGLVLIFPWIDRTQTVDVSNSAFSVPPQQLITHDGGIIEIGAEVQYVVSDCVALVREVADHQEMIRSLAKTVLIRMTVAKNTQQIVKDKVSSGQDVQNEMNSQVRKWGLDIRGVILSDVKLLKSPEGDGGIPPLLASLGHTSEGLSPKEFAKYIYSMKSVKEEVLDFQGIVEAAEQGKLDWTDCLSRIVGQEKFERDHVGKYIFIISDLEKKILFEITESGCKVKDAENEDCCDVSVTLTSSDLAGILKGSLPALQAYLVNRIAVTGDVRKLMLLDRIANKTHKQGQTFAM